MENFFGQEARPTGEAGYRELLRRFGNGEFDLVSVGRGHIGDQGIINKVRAGRWDDIRGFTRKDVLGDLELEDGIQFEAHGGHRGGSPERA